jgi:tryptophanyl-tRNA synthetase
METTRVFSGMRPTGRFHLGNYLGAVRNWVELQDKYPCIFCIVDFHALTTYPNASTFASDIVEMTADLIAVGIDPSRSILFVQSHVPQVAELHLILSMITPLSWVQRVPTFKEKVKSQPDNVNYGLLGYPILQAADVLLYKAELVPVGIDQLPHLELMREIVRRFHHTYGRHIFPEPKPELTDSPIILGIDGKNKMSKSLGNHIEVTAEPEEIRKRVMSMVTDPKRIYFSDPGHPEECNVCQLHKYFSPNWQELWDACRYSRIGCKEKKAILAENIIKATDEFRYRRKYIDNNTVSNALYEGKMRAQEIAEDTLHEVRKVVGLR